MHAVVVGCGRVGSTVARQLSEAGHDVVVIDKSAGAFSRLGEEFGGRTIEGIGFDRGILTKAGLGPDSAMLAVTSGDNSNILVARVARETFGVERVVARIYDPRRAKVYERLGIPTVATVAWTAGRAMRHILPEAEPVEWLDPTARFALVEHRVPESGAGRSVAELEQSGVKVVLLTRYGESRMPDSSVLLQQDDLLHLVVESANARVDVFGAREGGHE